MPTQIAMAAVKLNEAMDVSLKAQPSIVMDVSPKADHDPAFDDDPVSGTPLLSPLGCDPNAPLV